MPGIFDRLRAALRRKDSPAEELEAAVGAARGVLEKAQAKLEALRARRIEALQGDDAARSTHRLALKEAEAEVEDAGYYLAELSARHALAVAAEIEAARRERYKAAEAQRDAAASRIAAEYVRLARGLAQLIRLAAESDAEVAAVNAALPDGCRVLAMAEAQVRDWPALARKDMGTTEVEAWAYPGGGGLVPDFKVGEIRSKGAGHVLDGRGGPRAVVRVKLSTRRWLAEEGARSGPRLATLVLPGLTYGDPAIADGTDGDPARILAQLDALAAARPVPCGPREERTMTEIIEPAATAEAA